MNKKVLFYEIPFKTQKIFILGSVLNNMNFLLWASWEIAKLKIVLLIVDNMTYKSQSPLISFICQLLKWEMESDIGTFCRWNVLHSQLNLHFCEKKTNIVSSSTYSNFV